jgi:hypothetical protein
VRSLLAPLLPLALLGCASARPWKPAFDARCNCGNGGLKIETAAAKPEPRTIHDLESLDDEIRATIERRLLARAEDAPYAVADAREAAEDAAFQADKELGARFTGDLREARASYEAKKLEGNDDVAVLQQAEALRVSMHTMLEDLQGVVEAAALDQFAQCGQHYVFKFAATVANDIVLATEYTEDDEAFIRQRARALSKAAFRRFMSEECTRLGEPIARTIAEPIVARRGAEWVKIIRP